MTVTRIALFGTLAVVAISGQVAASEKDKVDVDAPREERGPVAKDGAWSETVAGLQARVVLRHSEVVNGTPIIATYLHLRNVTNSSTHLKLAWTSERLNTRLVDASGKNVPMRCAVWSGFGDSQADLVIPYKGTVSFEISQHGCGVPGDMAALIDLGSRSSYLIEPGDGACFLRAVLEIADPKVRDLSGADARKTPTREWHGRIELPPVPIPLKIDQLDPATAVGVIRKLGLTMLKPDEVKPREARAALSLIADDRVIPWYVKAMDTNVYELKFAALDRLSRFEGDAAFLGLSKGMSTQAKDIGNCTTVAVAEAMAANVRHAAAEALTRSPHQEAESLLLTLWNDPSPAVRTTVLHALGKMNSEKSLTLLKKMSEDSDKLVRDEAMRYLRLRAAEVAKPSDRGR